MVGWKYKTNLGAKVQIFSGGGGGGNLPPQRTSRAVKVLVGEGTILCIVQLLTFILKEARPTIFDIAVSLIWNSLGMV